MRKFFTVFLTMAVVLSAFAGCGGSPASTPGSQQTPASVSQPESEPAPPPEPPYDPAPLTGLPKDESYPEGQRITAVMVNNISDSSYQNARPQSGLSEADILIESKVEGGITRFCALYTDYRDLPQICPVRSARDHFFQIFLPFQPMYVHIGESVTTKWFIQDYDYESLNVDMDRVGFPRDYSRGNVAEEHMAYVDGELIQKGIDKLNIDTRRDYSSTFFDFVNYNEPARVLTGDPAMHIKVQHSQSYRTYFDWNEADGKYDMSQYSRAQGGNHPTIDANTGEQLQFDNVIVLFTEFDVYPDPGNSGYDLQDVNFDFGGVGYYFNGGRAEPIRWLKGAPLNALRIVDAEGNETSVKINPGKTYLGLVDLGELEKDPTAFEYWKTADGTSDAASSTSTSTAG